MYKESELKDAYKAILSAINLYPITQPIEVYSTRSIILYTARFASAPQLLNVLLWESKITVKQHASLHDQLHSDDAENWLVVFAFIKTLKDVQSRKN